MDLDMAYKYLKEMSQKSCGHGVLGQTADLSLLNNPNLEAPRQALDGQFIQLLVDQTSLLKEVTSLSRTECRGEIPRFNSCEIPAAGACAGAKCLPGFKIQDDYLTYDMVKYVVAMTFDQDMLDCNKYGEGIKNIAMQMLMTALSNAMESAAILGDEDIPTGDGQSDINNLLGVNDGWLKKFLNCTPEAQIIDAQGAGPSLALFMAAKKLLPTRFRGARGNFRFIGGPTLQDWYAETFGARITTNGDNAVVTGNVGSIWGVDFLPVNLWPEDMVYGNDAVTHIVYTPPKNLVHMAQRKLDFKTEYDLTCDKYLTVGYFRQDVAILDPSAAVIIKNVDMCGTAWAGCRTPATNLCATPNHNPDS